MEYISVTSENIEREHICCAISNNNDIQVLSKKAWLSERFEEGLVFLKSTERGKCFIEYIPAENAWNPILAEGYMYIDCLWVESIAKEKSVQFKAVLLQSKEEAQNAPTSITTYALFLNGNYITNEQMNDKRFLKLLDNSKRHSR